MNYFSFNAYIRENSMKCLGRFITPHVLRHTHASLMIEQGLSLDIIARRLGHEDSEITRKIYIHITERLKEKENQIIARNKDFIICPFSAPFCKVKVPENRLNKCSQGLTIMQTAGLEPAPS